jgi:GT2 family glycosyltransferase
VIIVDNFYSEEARAEVKSICAEFGCDFVACANNGYGSGNDAGIDFALKHYDFDFLVVANPDTVVEKMPAIPREYIKKPCVLGPAIRTLSGKRQNPCMVIYSPCAMRLMKLFALRPSNTLPFYAAVAINKAEREIFGRSAAAGSKRSIRCTAAL